MLDICGFNVQRWVEPLKHSGGGQTTLKDGLKGGLA
jgi:hypothetical protein